MAGVKRRASSATRRGLAALATVLLAACGGGQESDAVLIDYQRDLAARLALAAPEPRSPDNIGAFPERRQRLVEIPETREGMLDVYALRECRITTLVAERNSALGRVAPASQRWRYELELWQRLDTCLAGEVAERLTADDRARLERLTATKREQLPRATWNGLFGSEEWSQSFSRVSSPLPPERLGPPEAQLAALDYLETLSRAPFDATTPLPDLERLEDHLQALNTRPYTAELLRTLQLAEQRLGEASGLLDRALARHDGCQARDVPARLDASTEEERLAAWLEALEAAGQAWLEGLSPLFDTLEIPPEAVAGYRHEWLSLEHAEAPLPAFRDALSRHRSLRRTLAERCS